MGNNSSSREDPTGGDLDVSGARRLILEVLAARHRLGEVEWTFTREGTTTKALNWLADHGLVSYRHGNVPGTWLAELTTQGRATASSDTYEPPGTCQVCTERSQQEAQTLTKLAVAGIIPTGPGTTLLIHHTPDQ